MGQRIYSDICPRKEYIYIYTGERESERKGGREGGREGGRDEGREGVTEGGRE